LRYKKFVEVDCPGEKGAGAKHRDSNVAEKGPVGGIESLAGCRSQRVRSVRIAYGKGDDVSPASIAPVARRADEALLSTSAGRRLDDDATALTNLVHDQIVQPSQRQC
jgi:hypothetical protein